MGLKRLHNFPYHPHLYSDMPESASSGGTYSIAAKLGLKMPNLAPDVEEQIPMVQPIIPTPAIAFMDEAPNPLEPKKKKYAKEAWPGKKPTPSLLV